MLLIKRGVYHFYLTSSLSRNTRNSDILGPSYGCCQQPSFLSNIPSSNRKCTLFYSSFLNQDKQKPTLHPALQVLYPHWLSEHIAHTILKYHGHRKIPADHPRRSLTWKTDWGTGFHYPNVLSCHLEKLWFQLMEGEIWGSLDEESPGMKRWFNDVFTT